MELSNDTMWTSKVYTTEIVKCVPANFKKRAHEYSCKMQRLWARTVALWRPLCVPPMIHQTSKFTSRHLSVSNIIKFRSPIEILVPLIRFAELNWCPIICKSGRRTMAKISIAQSDWAGTCNFFCKILWNPFILPGIGWVKHFIMQHFNRLWINLSYYAYLIICLDLWRRSFLNLGITSHD